MMTVYSKPEKSSLRRRLLPEEGFTLVEFIVALAVMVILLSILMPMLADYRLDVIERERLANEDAINKAIRQCYALEGRYPPAEGDGGLGYLSARYGIMLKPDLYEYSYMIVDGRPQLSVARRGADTE
jgi:prepilin-type N-terminal cleavage/methylation domain-containing protein